MVAGQRYYIEALLKQDIEVNALAVAWTGPGFDAITVITGEYLTPYGIDTRIEGDVDGDGDVDQVDENLVKDNFGDGLGLSSLFGVRNAIVSGNAGAGSSCCDCACCDCCRGACGY